MRQPVIILMDRVFGKHRIFNAYGTSINLETLGDAQNFIHQSVDLREVYVNSKEGREILRRIGRGTRK